MSARYFSTIRKYAGRSKCGRVISSSKRFQPDETDIAIQRKPHFIRVQHVEENDFVTAEAEVPQRRENGFKVFEAIGNQADDPAAVNPVGDFVQQRPDGGAIARLRVFQRVRDGVDVPQLTALWQFGLPRVR